MDVSGVQQLLSFKNLILTLEYIKVDKVSLFLTSAPHGQMKSLLHGCHLVSYKATHTSFLCLALRRRRYGFQTYSISVLYVTRHPVFSAWSWPVLKTSTVLCCGRSGTEQWPFPPLTGHCPLNNSASDCTVFFLSATSLAHVSFTFSTWWSWFWNRLILNDFTV